MLIIGTPAAPVGRVTLQDFQLSGFCGSTLPPGGITIACLYCHLSRIGVTGFNNFGIEFTGAASQCCGFDDVNQAEIQVSSTTSVPTFAVQLTGMPGDVGGPDGVSVVSSNVNAGCSAAGNGFIKFENPGQTITASSSWIGNRFEAKCDYAFEAITGIMQLVRFTSNRWENTGSGGLSINLTNRLTTDPPAVFNSNNWSCGPGNCTFKDSTGRSMRSQEYFGPSTTSPNFFIMQSSGGAESGIAVTTQSAIPKTPLMNTRLIPGPGVYRVSLSLLLRKSASKGTLTGTISWGNGIREQTGGTPPLHVADPPGAEVGQDLVFYAAANQPIRYWTTFSDLGGSPEYTIRIRVEYVGP